VTPATATVSRAELAATGWKPGDDLGAALLRAVQHQAEVSAGLLTAPAAITPRKPSKGETLMAMALDADPDIVGWVAECTPLVLVPATATARAVTYRPDFVARHRTGALTMIEVKGSHVWDDAILKLKVVAPMVDGVCGLLVARYRGGGWERRVMTATPDGPPRTLDVLRLVAPDLASLL
jgi:hypothetical protein